MSILKTRRLNVRKLRDDDFHEIYRLQSDPGSMRYIRVPETDPEPVRARMKTWLEYGAQHPDLGVFALHSLENDAFAGYCTARHVDFDPARDFEIGYVLTPASRGMGLATEIAGALLEYLFRVAPDLEKVLAFTHPDNTASQNVLEKCGFQRTGTVNIYGGECLVFEFRKHNERLT